MQESVAVFLFVSAWAIVAVYVLVGNYLYILKVLPALARDGLDGSLKFTPWEQLEQVETFLARLAPDAPRPWYFSLLSHVRIITAVVGLLGAGMAVPTILSLWVNHR